MHSTNQSSSSPSSDSPKTTASVDHLHSRSPSPRVIVSTNFSSFTGKSDLDRSEAVDIELPVLSCQTPLSAAPVPRGPSPIAWSEAEWAEWTPSTASSRSISSENQASSNGSIAVSRKVESTLAATAPAFAFKPNPDAKAFVPPATGSTVQLGSLALADGPYAHPCADNSPEELWRGRVGYGIGFVPSHTLPPTPPPSIRERSSSLSSAHSSYFGSKAINSYDFGAAQRAQEHAALQSYFGPSSVEVNPPPGSFTQPMSIYSDLGSSPIYANGGGGPRNLPDVSDESPLYVAAREAFVATSVRSYSPAEAAAAAPTFISHFDRAMKSAYPLAALYSISKEKAAELAANPASSGVDELVLRVAARRMGLRGAEVGGPSANNRKLGLYKTELCRSWEEKGSCRYGAKCQFAHGNAELRPVARHPKFKSEVCRTFLTSGICPYGARCVFKHSTENGNVDSLVSSMSSLGFAGGANPDDPAQRTSRFASLRNSAQPTTTATFGPALANYLAPGSSPLNSHPSSPTVDRFRFNDPSVPFPSTEARKLSISVAPGEVPPQFAEAPQSRLHRLSQISSGGSSSSLGSSTSTLAGAGSSLRSRASFDSFAPTAYQQFNSQSTAQRHSISGHSLSRQPSFTNPFNPGASTAMSATVTPRHGSTSSFGSFASSSGYASSFLPRKESNSSLSSFTSSTHGVGALKPAGNEWFAQTGASTEWAAPVEDDTFADFTPLPSGLGLEQETITPARYHDHLLSA